MFHNFVLSLRATKYSRRIRSAWTEIERPSAFASASSCAATCKGNLARTTLDFVEVLDIACRLSKFGKLGKSWEKHFCGCDSVSPEVKKSRINIGEKNGGDDETRTRDLCRDRAAF
jgi:hypothetical protein